MKTLLSNIISKHVLSLTQKRHDFLKTKYNVQDNLLITLGVIDPTEKGIYVEWLIKQHLNKTMLVHEDAHNLSVALKFFEGVKNKSFFKDNKDINSYKTPGSLYKMLKEYDYKKGVPSDQSNREERVKGQYEVVVRGDDFTWYKVITPEAACELGSGTSWCTVPETLHGQQNTIAYEYLEEGPLYILYKGGKPQAQVHFESDQFMDVDDDSLKFRVGKYSFWKFAKELKALLNVLGKKIDLEDSNYPEDVQMQIFKSSPHNAVKYAEKVLGGPWPEMEDFIAENVPASFEYAKVVLKGRFPKGEARILSADDWGWMVQYAQDIIKGRWPEAERELIKDAHLDILIRYLIKNIGCDPWPEAEDRIAEDGGTARWYFTRCLLGEIENVTSQKLKNKLLA